MKKTDKWKCIPYSLIGRTNIAKMSILLKVSSRFNIIPIKAPKAFYMEIGKNAKIHNEPKKAP